MDRFGPVFRALGMIIMLFGLTMLVPLSVSWIADDGAQLAYDEAFAATMLLGFTLWAATRKERRELAVRDGFLMVVLTWSILPALASIPVSYTHLDVYKRQK